MEHIEILGSIGVYMGSKKSQKIMGWAHQYPMLILIPVFGESLDIQALKIRLTSAKPQGCRDLLDYSCMNTYDHLCWKTIAHMMTCMQYIAI